MSGKISLEDIKFFELSDGRRLKLVGTSKIVKQVL